MNSVLRSSPAPALHLLAFHIPGSTLRWAVLAICIGTLGASSLLQAADPADQDAAIYERIDKVGDPSIDEGERKAQSAALLDDEAWVQKTWRRISNLAIQCRYDKPLTPPAETSPEEIKPLEVEKPKSKKADDPLALPEKDEPGETTDQEYATAVRSRAQLASLVRALTLLQDERVPRLIGPLLGEVGMDLSDEDTMIQSPQTIAAGTLAAMLSPDGKVTDYPEETDVDGWRRWWGENKERFGNVLTVSARIDEAPTDPEVEIIGLGAPKPKATPAPRQMPQLPSRVTPPAPTKPEKPIIRAVPIERRSAPAR